MKTKVLFLGFVFILCSLFPLFAQNTNTSEKPKEQMFKAMAGISMMPWTFWQSGQWLREQGYYNGLEYDLDTNAFTSYEGQLWHKSGLKLGFGADVDDNFIGKLNKWAGYLGFKKLALRVAGGDITGTAYWKATPVPGQPETASVHTKYITVDLMYGIGDPSLGMYVGLSYTSYEMPVELQGLTKNNKGQVVGANLAYDDAIKFQNYAITFGFDNLNGALMTGREGFNLWIFTQDSFFGGPLHVSDEGMRRLQNANPTLDLLPKQDFVVIGVQYDITAGISYTKKLGPVMLGAGVGYNFSGRAMYSFATYFNTIQEGSNQMMAVTEPYLFHHGVVFKLAIAY